ncbi:hypothetical protein Poli38472_010414 [Pythium oligandrum]|uniref:Uncharacterized protein n=1 Tax=Pythium oligandrum TaxID=41045 RepID=A0A8K1FDF4_PYTOL|nr:hypothetical protein Poli38472_010414 [Pythium oligandrum]|eukprot:TMW55532.1 hypothetical protein Poli38472_010414 [Pythium oligandrum]
MASDHEDDASYESSSSSSSENTVLISKSLQEKRRKKLQQEKMKQRAQDDAAAKAAQQNAGNKAEWICGVCEKQGDLYVCTGSCVAAYHLSCLSLVSPPSSRENWLCPSCVSHKHVCFHCKEQGVADGASTAAAGASETESSESKRTVVKCRALSCGKYYHEDCIAKLPLARIAGSRFICPLHTCSACEQSGAKKEPVRCTRCPVAYHTSCLPRSGVVNLPGKRIICPKHDVKVDTPSVTSPPQERADTKADEQGSRKPPALQRIVSAEAESVASADENDDAVSETSKKSSKKDKKDKKKKKKKRKKLKKKEKERSSSSFRDGEDGEGKDEKSKKSKSSRSHRKEEDGDEDDEKNTVTGSDDDDEEEEEDEAASVRNEANSKPPVAEETTQENPSRSKMGLSDMLNQAGSDASPVRDVAVDSRHDARDRVQLGESIASADRVKDEGRSSDSRRNDESPQRDFSTPRQQADQAYTQSPQRPLIKEEAEESSEGRVAANAQSSDNISISASVAAASDEQMNEGHDADDESVESRRDGDRTPVEASRDKSNSSGRSKKKKKKKVKGGDSRRGDGKQQADDDDDDEEEEEEAKWVQCDGCKKWRTVPKSIDLDAMPDRWYCRMNSWDKAFASCDVAEEVVDAGGKSKKNSSGEPPSKKLKTTQKQGSDADTAGRGSEASNSGSEKTKAAAKLAKKQEKDAKKRNAKDKIKEKYGEVKWVQCESAQCGKWRVVPSSIDFDLLPAVWYCHLNTWAPELANCSALNPPEVDTFLSKNQSKKPSSARPSKKLKTGDHPQGSTNAHQAAFQGQESNKSSKSNKPPKGSTPTAHPNAAYAGFGGLAPSAMSVAVPGTPGGAADGSKGRKGIVTGAKSAVLEWAQCEKCNKWRKLPAHIKSSTLPDKWYCSMNHWDPSRASCSIAQEEDQEPVDASPLPSSQNWYPMPGKVGPTTTTSVGAVRKRGKLSYSELLYASTGQLRKTYTSESSTLSFDYEGVTYHRDDQYKNSSMYVSPLTTNKLTGEPIESPKKKGKENDFFADQRRSKLLEQITDVILAAMDLRRDHSISDIVESVTRSDTVQGSDLSLSIITAALTKLVTRGLVEKVAQHRRDSERDHVEEPVFKKHKSILSTSDLLGALSQPAYYRKVPKRPLKALKAWKMVPKMLDGL